MRCLIVSCVYPPEPVVSAQTSAQIAQRLVEKGYEVKVITTFPNRPGGRTYDGYSRRLFKSTRMPNGLELVRCYSSLSPKSMIFSRFLENITFGLTSGWVVLTSKKVDVIYSNSWPIFATGIIGLIARLRRVPLVINVQDLHPEALFVQERVRQDSWIIKMLKWVDGDITRKSQAIIVISQRFAEVYIQERKVPFKQVHVLPNWVEGIPLQDIPHNNSVRADHNIPDDAFLLVYGGNIGEAAGVESVIEAFRNLFNLSSFYLLIAGDGTNLANCQELASAFSLEHIRFCTPWNNDYRVLIAADVLILCTRGKQSLTSVPSKLLAYMLSARPILATVVEESDTANVIKEAGCGWVIEPNRVDLLAKKIEELADLSGETLNAMGNAGREYALEHFSTEQCLPKVINIIERTALEKAR